MPLSQAAYRRIALALLTLGFALLLGLAGAVIVLVERNAEAAERGFASLQAQASLHEAFSQLQDAETGQRGYLLTGDPAYLAPYRRAVGAVMPALATAAARIGADQSHATELPVLRRLAEAKLAELRETIALAEAGDAAAALAIVRSDRGRSIMDQYRARQAALTVASARRLAAATAAQARTGQWLAIGAAAAAGLILAVAIGCGLLLRGYLAALHAAGEAVRESKEGLERRVAERTAALAEANAELQRFAYIVSHDLRSPLVNVMGFTAELEAALMTLKDPASTEDPQSRARLEADIAEAIGFIRAATGRMDRLIGAILRLSREGGRRLEPEPLEMTAVIEGIVAGLSHQLEGRDASVEIRRPLPALTADRVAIEQIFGNLLDNAVKYLDPGRPGRIVVRGRATRRDGNALFEVADNGRGVAPGDRERIFELFRRAGAQDRPGEGIGLAHVRALVRRLGGTILCAAPEDGPGTVFRVTLPVRPMAAGAGREG